MRDLIIKLIQKIKENPNWVNDDIKSALAEICQDVHSNCHDECPVHYLNGGPVNPQKPFEVNRGCDCYGSGEEMFKFIEKA